MAKSNLVARVLEGGQLECQVTTPGKRVLTLTGTSADPVPVGLDGPDELSGNRALVDNAWAYATFNFLKVNLPSEDEQTNAGRRADAHRDIASWIAELADDITDEAVTSWCSGCFALTEHRKVNRPFGQLPAHLCSGCGSPTLPCADPRCENMAVRSKGAVRVPRYCAEHRHEITGFTKANAKMSSLGDYADFLEFDKPHLGRTTKLVGVAVAGLATGGLAALSAAPAIGGAIGSVIGGYSGAAASSYGLALLGGGSIAAGGLGMFGGTLVVSAVGGALGSALGASVTNAYIREDSSFHIEMLQGGEGTPVIVCNGFLSESGRGWGEWKEIVTRRYPDSPVYRVHWGAKELRDLGILASLAAIRSAGLPALETAAATATKAGAQRLGPLAPLLMATSLAKNPWHVAKSRADKTGVVLADLLARTEVPSYVLVGHSLGARIMAVAAQTVGTKPDGPRLQAVHLLGAAIRADGNWSSMTERVDDAVYNYHSANDGVLKYLYTVAQGGQSAAGLNGFRARPPKLKNVDVSDRVERHSDYHESVHLL